MGCKYTVILINLPSDICLYIEYLKERDDVVQLQNKKCFCQIFFLVFCHVGESVGILCITVHISLN